MISWCCSPKRGYLLFVDSANLVAFGSFRATGAGGGGVRTGGVMKWVWLIVHGELLPDSCCVY